MRKTLSCIILLTPCLISQPQARPARASVETATSRDEVGALPNPPPHPPCDPSGHRCRQPGRFLDYETQKPNVKSITSIPIRSVLARTQARSNTSRRPNHASMRKIAGTART